MGELIVNGVKWAFIIALALTFVTAIQTLIDLSTTLVFTGILGELFGMLSCVLPFNMLNVVGALMVVFNALLSFKVAKKIYELTGMHVKI